jgi:glyoxylase-like metal-dependent hydrolase (beta-lactamase superfamily II)
MPAMKTLPALAALALLAACAATGPQQAGVERLYVIDCGENRVTDLSFWSPGENVGRSFTFGNHCYLIKHAKGWMLWDTGNSDALAALPNGLVVANGRITAFMAKPLAASLKEIGVAPEDIRHLAMSHTHADHSGNANLFTAATLYMQEPEYNAAFGPEPQKFGFNPASYGKLKENIVVKLNGDHDVFGDGSVVIKYTPGHTPGHQSLLVRLPRTGPVLLSGDMVHFEDNWAHKRVPQFNFNREQSVQSMNAMEAYLKETGAQLWINHDKAQSARLVKAPQYIE